MFVRVGKITNTYPSDGKVKVMYEDEKNTSLPLSLLTMNNEVSMPKIGDRVVTIHMGNGSSKGFVLGTYYGGSTQPKAGKGYRKDLGNGAYVTCVDGGYELHAESVTICADSVVLECAYGKVGMEEMIKRLERIEDSLGLPHTVQVEE